LPSSLSRYELAGGKKPVNDPLVINIRGAQMECYNPLNHIALVAVEAHHLSFSELCKVSAALQKQVMRDFGSIWGIQSTVDAFEKLEDVPIDYWPIIVSDNIDASGVGTHKFEDGQPYALVQHHNEWSLTASHECLEMLCNPTGNRVIAGESPITTQGRVAFLVEVCDPSEDVKFAYPVNGILVSDFYTPHYFDPVASSGVRYSFTDAIKKPRMVLEGGYLSWHDPITDHWFQEVFFDEKHEFREVGKLTEANDSIRSMIYEKTPEALKAKTSQAIPESPSTSNLKPSSEKASNARAKMLRVEINNLLKKK
jgi:hypothetical protein